MEVIESNVTDVTGIHWYTWMKQHSDWHSDCHRMPIGMNVHFC